MAASGPSEIILLSAGLIVAALVSGILLQTWDDMDDVLDERGKQGAEDVRTRVSLVSDPINIQWDDSDNVKIHLQNSGDTFLDVNSVGAVLGGTTMTVTVTDGVTTEWLPGDVVQFTLTNSGLDSSLSSGDNDLLMTVSVSSTATGYTGLDTLREEEELSSPNVDNFDFGVIQDSLGQSMGTAIPNRALMLVCGGIGSGKSIMGQRMSFGMTANDVKVSLFTTELTTRGWLEQVSSIGYYMDKRIDEGSFHLVSSFGVIAEPSDDQVTILDLLESPASKEAEVVIIDRASELMHEETSGKELLRILRKFTSEGRTLILTLDPDEMDNSTLRDMKNSAEVVLDMMTAVVGGQLVRTVSVTRFLRAAGPVTERIGWKVMPEMGFIVDITAVHEAD